MSSLSKYRFALKRAKKRNRVPKWVDRQALFETYRRCPKNKRVDHIIPLHGELVSGLHVPENLQYLSERENQDKANSFTPMILAREG